MIRNFFKVGLRNLLRNPLHTSINIFGLAIGITSCLAIFTILKFEYSYNKHHPDSERIYRIYSVFSGAFSGINRGVPGALPNYIRDNFSGLEAIVNFHTYSSKVEIPLKDGTRKEIEGQKNLVITVPEYFDLVGQYVWLAGTKNSLQAPFKVVLVESQAKKYFGDIPYDEMLGKQVIYRDSLDMEVSGIVKDIPNNTDFIFTDILSFATIGNSWLKDNFSIDWGSTNSSSQLFVKLSKGTPLENLKEQLETANAKYKEETKAEWINTFNVQPLPDLHYNTEIGVFDNGTHVANRNTLEKLSLVALALLLIAAINFINLETAIATKRSKEVGIRKVMGSTRSLLVLHFLTESFMVTIIAVFLSLPLVKLSLMGFHDYIPEGVAFNIQDTQTLLLLLGTIFIVGLLAGLYPAFVMSSFSPDKSLKAQSGTGTRNSMSANLRKGLTIFQFGFSQILIIGTIVIAVQIHYMLNVDMGFTKDPILYFYTPYYENVSKQDVLRNELNKNSDILSLTIFNDPPIQSGYSSSVVKYNKPNGEQLISNVFQKGGDTTYVNFFGLQLIAGRNLRDSKVEKETLINETYMKDLGFDTPADVLGQQIYRSNDTLTIVGVVKDFHYRSLHNPIEDAQISIRNGMAFGIKIAKGTNTEEAIQEIKEAYQQVYPDRKFTSYFMDDTINKFYQSEERTGKLALTATIIAIIISCLGLFALASFTSVQRTKEIGIRKALGATVNSIVTLLSKDFLKLVIIAFMISIPFAWWVSKMWLEDFAYKIPISVWIFVSAGLGSILIAFLTVSYQSIKAAMTNPANSLRYE